MQQIDEFDKKIIALLDEDGRTPFSNISKTLEISNTMAHQRVSKLIDSGVIASISPILNEKKRVCCQEVQGVGPNNLYYECSNHSSPIYFFVFVFFFYISHMKQPTLRPLHCNPHRSHRVLEFLFK